MSGRRFRIVTITDDEEYVSGIVYGEEEAEQHLRFEAELHRLAGWNVTDVNENDHHVVLAARPGRTRRIFARAYDPMDDERR